MFVTTFYSYKGGVGRTMALANVAAELANRGKSVLVADFDLEAPGLPSFSFDGCPPVEPESGGIVEFIEEWRKAGQAPDIRKYVSACNSRVEGGGRIWVMPAGRIDASYGARLSEIDFKDLYEFYGGYLLLEDLKAQWSKVLSVDYVLIDSRTGHTDVGGICTRQLPDLVVFVFWPNVQNLRGLESIVHDIRSEESESGREIAKIFAPSNLPTLDDEEEILQDLLAEFRSALNYDVSEENKIHNYPSIDLLAQKIFVEHRPKSRLAREYRTLCDLIISQNLNDVEGVRLFLKGLVNDPVQARPRVPWPQRSGKTSPLVQRRAARISHVSKHEWEDPDINRSLARIKADEGDLSAASKLLSKVMIAGSSTLGDHLRLANWALSAGAANTSQNTIDRLLDDDDATARHVTAALCLLLKYGTDIPSNLNERPGILRLSLPQIVSVTESLQNTRAEARLAANIVRSALVRFNRGSLEGDREEHLLSLALPLISGQFFSDAVDLLSKLSQHGDWPGQRKNFNLAMAIWGSTGVAPIDIFSEIITCESQLNLADKFNTPNYHQCMALSFGVLGDRERGLEFVNRSRDRVEEYGSPFSCWSYLARSTFKFGEELSELRTWIENRQGGPVLFRDTTSDGIPQHVPE